MEKNPRPTEEEKRIADQIAADIARIIERCQGVDPEMKRAARLRVVSRRQKHRSITGGNDAA